MTTKIDDFIKRVESTAEEDLFTPRTFYHLSSSMFHEMCELLKEQEAELLQQEAELDILRKIYKQESQNKQIVKWE